MIGRLSGVAVERGSDGTCVLDVEGVGYEVFVPFGVLGRLPPPPKKTTLHIHTHVREDVLSLFGFETMADRAAFRSILGISGVGPKLAMAIMSTMNAGELASAIALEDKTRFKGIPGIGKKTAERLVLELRDKLPKIGEIARAGIPTAPPVGSLGMVASALVQMGYKQVQAEKAVAGLDADGKSVEELLRAALGQLS